MSREAMWAVLMKDIKGIRSSVQIWLPMVIVPVVFCVVLPALLVIGLRYWGSSGIGNIEDVAGLLDKLPAGELRESILAWNTLEKQVLYFVVNYVFAPFFLLIPLMASSVITANSFAGEKERKTLESLLFSPIEIPTLFVAKMLSAFIPAMGLTWLCTALYGLVVNFLAHPLFGQVIFPKANWLVLILWATPALSLFTILVNLFISAKVKGFQEAYQLGGLVVLPVVGLVISQVFGVLVVDANLLWLIGAFFFVIDIVFVRRVARHLDRNRLFESQVW